MQTQPTTENTSTNPIATVSAQPVKRFFVEMLTRDIAVEDAILDLLDNCVDGANRTRPEATDPDHPYQGYYAHITVNRERFEIEDNCGGIPADARDRAFRMGRDTSSLTSANPERPMVGVYGIGMKRAVFKMGLSGDIMTKHGNDAYHVPITEEWMRDNNRWDLDVFPYGDRLSVDGTIIAIDRLRPDIAERFSSHSFVNSLVKQIKHHYAVIIRKGLQVKVNNQSVTPEELALYFDQSNGIAPYFFSTEWNDVKVFLTVGLRQPIPGVQDVLDEQEARSYSSDQAGWTVICNDRVVIYCNKDELTGWGTSKVPRYHTQFIAISGIVEFNGDPLRLPTNTTKRGLDVSSSLYQQVLNRMREGLLLFTTFTNDWKAREEEAKNLVKAAAPVVFEQLKDDALSGKVVMRNLPQSSIGGQQYKPQLPTPPNDSPFRRISYMVEINRINDVAGELIPNLEDIKPKDIPRKVGEASFEYAYDNLKKTNGGQEEE